ncbi:MAG: carbohydrate binding domain-containing protein [Acidobacteriaceae bacterium]
MKATSTPFAWRWFSFSSCSLLLGLAFLVGLGGDGATASAQSNGVTNIAIGTQVKTPAVKRLGINLSGQSYYDSGQMLRNLIFRNPGFEGQIWQSILVCHTVTATSCTDDDPYNQWPKDFIKGAPYEFIYGAARGQTGTVTGMQISDQSNRGITVTFANLKVKPAVGDYYIVRAQMPGNPLAGWWPGTYGGGTLAAESSDLAPNSAGKQALRMTAAKQGQSASVASYFDSTVGRSFVQMNGSYTLSFRAKGAGGGNQLNVSVGRIGSNKGNLTYLSQNVTLSNAWKDYSFRFSAAEKGVIGTAAVSFSANGSSALLDDASLVEDAAADNPTAYRNAVVYRLRALHPGVLRYMDNGTDFGSTIDNMLAAPFGRVRAGNNERINEQDDVPMGLHEFLVLCQAVGAEPWFTVPAVTSPAEMQHLIQYLGGDSSTHYGGVRTALGQAAPWTTVFSTIHLEFGNETWNVISFPGEKISDPVAYGTRTGVLFTAAKTAREYNGAKFDLIMDGWAAVPWWSQQELQAASNVDTIDAAPYLFNTLNDYRSNETIFGPMFAQPEQVDSTAAGTMAQQAKVASSAARPVKLAVYEVNLSTVQGTASQSVLDAVVPSVGAGIAVVDHMLTMMRDDGVVLQNMFALPEYENGFTNTAGGGNENVKLWGAVVDMGGQTNASRPQFLAEQLANTAITGNLLATVQTGANPTWNQPHSTNDDITLAKAHYLQSFAFRQGSSNGLIVFNLHRTQSLPVTFSGANAPRGKVQMGRLTSAHLTDGNEVKNTVAITNTAIANLNPNVATSLPPFSMTVFTWTSTATPLEVSGEQ